MLETKRINNTMCAYSLSNMAFYQLYKRNNFLFPVLDVISAHDFGGIFEVEISGPVLDCVDAIYIYRMVMKRIGEIENGQSNT